MFLTSSQGGSDAGCGIWVVLGASRAGLLRLFVSKSVQAGPVGSEHALPLWRRMVYVVQAHLHRLQGGRALS